MAQDNAKSQQVDQELQFKKRARRRLVGAVALVLIMVTVLPMVLDDHSKKLPQPEIAITIPSQDEATLNNKPDSKSANEAATIENVPAVETPAEPVPSETPNVESSKNVEPAKVEAPVVETPKPTAAPVHSVEKPEKTPEKSKPAPVKTEAPASKKVPAEKAEAVKPASQEKTNSDKANIDKPSADKPAEPANKSNTVKSTSDKASNDKPAEVNHISYVQIGVFSDEANVKQLQQQLKDAGFKSFTEKLDTPKGVKLRLRAGPFASRSDASSALDKIKSMGLAGMIVSK